MNHTKYILILLLLFPVFSFSQKLKVLGTTSFLADLAKNVAGEYADVQSLMPLGGDPHIYEPIPDDARKIADADVIFKNGLTLEGWLDEMITHSGTKAEVVTVSEGVKAIESEGHKGAYDPHAWMDVANALIYIQNIKKALITSDPKNTRGYEANYVKYKAELEGLNQEIAEKILKIPKDKRILVTSHDAFRYYGNHYGLQVESVLGTSTEAEVRFEDIQHLSDVIDRYKIPVVFIESTINPKLMKQISKDRKTKVGGKLFADSLGDEESGADTYINMLRHNTNEIVAGLLMENAANEPEKKEESPLSFILTIAAIFAAAFFAVVYGLRSKNTTDANWQKYSIDIEGITVSYDKKVVLSNLYLSIESGYVYGLIGGNGSGKSTLMKTIVGILKADTGKITLNGKNIDDVRKYIAYVPQKEEIDWTFPATVADVVLMGRYPHRKVFERFLEEDKIKVREALEKMGIADLMHRQIGELSGGQQQRVFIARALCQEAEIFLFDEPFVGVDITTEEKIMEIVKQLGAAGKMIVIIHHDLAKIRDYFDRLIMINQRVVAVGNTADVFTDENIRQTYGGSLTILHLANDLNR
jgi:ABC-type Mn2+/Zn2+ transport system ATPase subunit/ABC-type Zn uptake system ZnuABC Zn-binding protein ZnuA